MPEKPRVPVTYMEQTLDKQTGEQFDQQNQSLEFALFVMVAVLTIKKIKKWLLRLTPST